MAWSKCVGVYFLNVFLSQLLTSWSNGAIAVHFNLNTWEKPSEEWGIEEASRDRNHSPKLFETSTLLVRSTPLSSNCHLSCVNFWIKINKEDSIDWCCFHLISPPTVSYEKGQRVVDWIAKEFVLVRINKMWDEWHGQSLDIKGGQDDWFRYDWWEKESHHDES
jgi:hypothetical protein